MENIILSLLLIKSMTTYEMKTFIHQTLSTVCSDSLGSIQTALKKLLEKGFVEVTDHVENHVLKREYSITENGLTQFKEWIKVPMDIHKAKNMEEGKFFFLGMVPKEVRMKSLEGYISSLCEEQKKMMELRFIVESTRETAVKQNAERIRAEEHLEKRLLASSGDDSLETTLQTIIEYQIYNLEYAEQRLRDDISFFQMIFNREKKKERD